MHKRNWFNKVKMQGSVKSGKTNVIVPCLFIHSFSSINNVSILEDATQRNYQDAIVLRITKRAIRHQNSKANQREDHWYYYF